MFKLARIISVLLLLVSSVSIGQLEGFKFQELSKDSLLKIANEVIKTQRTCTFITVDEYGKPQARVLAYFPPEDDWKIWLGTSTNSRKVMQVKNNPNVIVFYFDPEGGSYVSIAGKAQIINDPELKKEYWKDEWKVFYPNPEKDYVLIEVAPVHLEICSFKYKLFWDSSLKPAFVDF
jgi:general stress protein 26